MPDYDSNEIVIKIRMFTCFNFVHDKHYEKRSRFEREIILNMKWLGTVNLNRNADNNGATDLADLQMRLQVSINVLFDYRQSRQHRHQNP